jgi:hypothetical protein
LKAGQIVPVRFWTPELKDTKTLPKNKMTQARHGGGMCEFSLSYDGGKTFHVIGSYTKTCPDGMFFGLFLVNEAQAVCCVFICLKKALLSCNKK